MILRTASICIMIDRGQLKCDGTRAETRFGLSGKRTSPFKSAWASIQSTTGSRGVRISGSNAGYTMFRGSVKSTGYTLHTPVSPSLPLPCVTVCHHISMVSTNDMEEYVDSSCTLKIQNLVIYLTLSTVSWPKWQNVGCAVDLRARGDGFPVGAIFLSLEQRT